MRIDSMGEPRAGAVRRTTVVLAGAILALAGCHAGRAESASGAVQGADAGPWQTYDTVTTREFELVDHEGNVRVRIATEPDGATTRLELLDQGGRRVVDLGLRAGEGAWFTMADGNGRVRWRVATMDGSGPVLEMRDAGDRVRLRIGTAAGGAPSIEILDEAGRVVGRLP